MKRIVFILTLVLLISTNSEAQKKPIYEVKIITCIGAMGCVNLRVVLLRRRERGEQRFPN